MTLLEECKAKGGKLIDNLCVVERGEEPVKTKERKFQMSYTLTFALLFGLIFLAIIIGPIFPVWLVIPLAVILFFVLKHLSLVKPFKTSDLLFIPSILIGYVFLGMIFGIWAISAIPWNKIIIAGIVADGISFASGWLEGAGYVAGFVPGLIVSFVSALLTWFLVVSIIGSGFFGMILAMIAAFIVLLPGPIPLVTISFIIIKLLLSLFGG